MRVCVYECGRVLTSVFLLTALSHKAHDPLEKVRKLVRRHILVGMDGTSEVGLLLLLEVGHPGAGRRLSRSAVL